MQAVDLPAALTGLLAQAKSLLKQLGRGAPATGSGGAAAAAASRRSLVLGLLLVLERAAALAKQQRSPKLLKVGDG